MNADNRPATLLLTGGMGFIGSSLIRHVREVHPDWRIVNLDLLTYAANPANLEGVCADDDAHYRFVHGDIADADAVRKLFEEESISHVINCAAETHVDRAIDATTPFLRTNVGGTSVMLDAARDAGVKRYLQVSTDEVYGSLESDDPPFTEDTQLEPRSPYSASKAAADLLALSYYHTHGMDVVVTRASNNYGPRQHPEKLIPFLITSALEGRPLPIYGDGLQRRDWIHVADHCAGILRALERGRAGRVYNISGDGERANIEVAREVMTLLSIPADRLEHVTDRPGHDRRYAMSSARAHEELDWRPSRDFEEGLVETVAWYRANSDWWADSATSAHDESTRRISEWAAR